MCNAKCAAKKYAICLNKKEYYHVVEEVVCRWDLGSRSQIYGRRNINDLRTTL